MEQDDVLRQQIATMRQSLLDEEILNNFYVTVEVLDKGNPSFAEEVMNIFLRDSTKMIATIEESIEVSPIDVEKVKLILHRLLSGASSLGVNKVEIEVRKMMECVRAGDFERAKNVFQNLKTEHETLRSRVEPYFQLQRQVGPVGTAERPQVKSKGTMG
ncbi:hypothetical protein UlMin_022153 [Ulmus minor]